MTDPITQEFKANDTGVAGQPGRLFTWPNFLFIGALVLGCYYRINHDTSHLPGYILAIDAIGMGVWIWPFAMFYNIKGGKKPKMAYIAASILFVLLLPIMAAF